MEQYGSEDTIFYTACTNTVHFWTFAIYFHCYLYSHFINNTNLPQLSSQEPGILAAF